MPAAMARSTTRREASSFMAPKLLQPRPMTETAIPDLPSSRVSMGSTLLWLEDRDDKSSGTAVKRRARGSDIVVRRCRHGCPQRSIQGRGQRKRAPVSRRPDSWTRRPAYQLAPREIPTTRGSSENTLVYRAEVGSVRYTPVGLRLLNTLVANTFAYQALSGALSWIWAFIVSQPLTRSMFGSFHTRDSKLDCQ